METARFEIIASAGCFGAGGRASRASVVLWGRVLLGVLNVLLGF